MIWAYASVSGFHHVGHMRGYSYTDAICRFKRMTGHNVLLTAGGHATGNSAIARAQKIAEGDKELINTWRKLQTSDHVTFGANFNYITYNGRTQWNILDYLVIVIKIIFLKSIPKASFKICIGFY